ncbi:cytochrome P450 [Actinocatenispora sera]|uniref:cytochrome P450 n=1 Tax=Actinocatenispora sera TaxID=390989 RepID=UPI0033F6E72D
MPVPRTDAGFARDPLPAMLSWATDPADPPVRRLTADRYLVTDPPLGRRILASTQEPFEATSAPFGAVAGWIPGHPDTRSVLTALADVLDRALAGSEVADTPALSCWPDDASLLYLHRFGSALLPAASPAVFRAVAAALTRSYALDRRPGRGAALRRRFAVSRANAALHGHLLRQPVTPANPFLAALLDRFGDRQTAALALHGALGAVCRAAATALSWTVLLDHGWRPGLAAGTVLPATTPAAPAGDRVREALRLWPVAWMLHRRARKAAELGGLQVRAGDHLLVCTFAMHRSRGVWSDPDDYRPERWADPPAGYRDGYLPYGTGPGACVGARFVNAAAAQLLDSLPQLTAPIRLLDERPVLGAIATPPRFQLTTASCDT